MKDEKTHFDINSMFGIKEESAAFGFGHAMFGFNKQNQGFVNFHACAYETSEGFLKALIDYKKHLQNVLKEIEQALQYAEEKSKFSNS